MGFLSRWRFTRPLAEASAAPKFENVVGTDDIDPALFGLPSWSTVLQVEARISRREAIQVGAVKRSRDLIAGTLGSLPLCLFDKSHHEVDGITSALLDQPEADRPRSVTVTNTIEDMLFEGRAWWRITKFGWHGYPVQVVKLDARSVDVRGQNQAYVRPDGSPQGSVWEWVPDSELIRFESPNDPLLIAGARAIRTALRLDGAASNYASEPMPSGYFSPKEGADPASDDDVSDVLDKWKTSRQTRSTGYVPAALDYNPVQWSPADMQLTEARDHAVKEIARVAGVDPEDLGVSTTTRTYLNGEQRQRDFLNFTLAGYVAAFEGRLSMGDVTPRGYYAKLDLDNFLKADAKTRWETYQIAKGLGALTVDEIREEEDQPALTPAQRKALMPAPAPVVAVSATPAPTGEISPVAPAAAVQKLDVTFDAPQVIPMDSVTSTAQFAVDLTARTITGLAVPYGRPALSGGRRWQFAQGSLKYGDVSRVKLLLSHDFAQAIGKAVSLTETAAGLMAVFKVARGDAGDRALILAEDGVLDGLSVGVGPGGTYAEVDGVQHATSAPLLEISLTPSPAFDDARVTDVAASATTERTFAMPCPTCGQNHAPGTPCAVAPAATETAPDFTAQIDAGIQAALTKLTGGGPREVVPAGRQTFESVTEPALYSMDGTRGKHCFSSDLIESFKGDSEAGQRVQQFMDGVGPTFNVATADVATINPNIQRPDLYVDQKTFEYPMLAAMLKGTLTENTPFVLPKFSTGTGLVADHSAGVEPTTGAFTTTSQTVTPTPLSGKVTINREVWDQGGNPQLDTILWRQIERAYYEGLETAIQAFLVANAASITDITVTTAAADAVLEASLTSQLAPLQYVRGGNRFRDFFLQIDLFKALIAAKDSNGRKLFPFINPQNATGSVSAFYNDILIGGLVGKPAWATAATGTVAASSWLLDRGDVSVWASAPRKLTMDNVLVSAVHVGVWGYKALAVTDFTGIREVIYDPV